MVSMIENTKWFVYNYKDGKFIHKTHTFPVRMDYEDFIKHLGFTEVMLEEKGDNEHRIYSSNDRDEEGTGSYRYLIDIDLFSSHFYLVICEHFSDLLDLLNKLEGLRGITFSHKNEYK